MPLALKYAPCNLHSMVGVPTYGTAPALCSSPLRAGSRASFAKAGVAVRWKRLNAADTDDYAPNAELHVCARNTILKTHRRGKSLRAAYIAPYRDRQRRARNALARARGIFFDNLGAATSTPSSASSTSGAMNHRPQMPLQGKLLCIPQRAARAV